MFLFGIHFLRAILYFALRREYHEVYSWPEGFRVSVSVFRSRPVHTDLDMKCMTLSEKAKESTSGLAFFLLHHVSKFELRVGQQATYAMYLE